MNYLYYLANWVNPISVFFLTNFHHFHALASWVNYFSYPIADADTVTRCCDVLRQLFVPKVCQLWICKQRAVLTLSGYRDPCCRGKSYDCYAMAALSKNRLLQTWLITPLALTTVSYRFILEPGPDGCNWLKHTCIHFSTCFILFDLFCIFCFV